MKPQSWMAWESEVSRIVREATGQSWRYLSRAGDLLPELEEYFEDNVTPEDAAACILIDEGYIFIKDDGWYLPEDIAEGRAADRDHRDAYGAP